MLKIKETEYTVRKTLKKYDIIINEAKCQTINQTPKRLLGVEFNKENTWGIPPDKCRDILKYVKKHVAWDKLRSKMNYYRFFIPTLQRIQTLYTQNKYDEVYQELIEVFKVKFYRPVQEKYELYVDSSNSGWGAVLHTQSNKLMCAMSSTLPPCKSSTRQETTGLLKALKNAIESLSTQVSNMQLNLNNLQQHQQHQQQQPTTHMFTDPTYTSNMFSVPSADPLSWVHMQNPQFLKIHYLETEIARLKRNMLLENDEIKKELILEEIKLVMAQKNKLNEYNLNSSIYGQSNRYTNTYYPRRYSYNKRRRG